MIRPRPLAAPLLALLFLVAAAAPAIALRTGGPASSAAEQAQALLETLDAGQRAEALVAADDSRLDWHFIPKDDRKGLTVGEMDEEQQSKLVDLMRTLVSDVGERKIRGAMTLEALVAVLEGEGRRWPRDPELYYLTLFGDAERFGEPGVRWGLSFEGHHVSMNFTLEGDTVVDSTPQFLGAHPADVKEDMATAAAALDLEPGYRLLGEEESIAFDLFASLDDTQRDSALIAAEAPREVATAGSPTPDPNPARGLAASEMTDAQQEMLKRLVMLYVEIVAEPLAQQRVREIEEAGFGNVVFGWAGGDAPGEPHYYRIEGPTFEIELANTQPDAEGNPANHSHAMYRDNRGDFGLDEPR